MSEHQGIKYVQLSPGKWRLTYPSGYKGVVDAETEEEVKQKIDEIHSQMVG